MDDDPCLAASRFECQARRGIGHGACRPSTRAQIFLQAVALPADERSAYLHEACGDNRELYTEVESLLAHHSRQTLLEVHRQVGALGDVPTPPDGGTQLSRIQRAGHSLTSSIGDQFMRGRRGYVAALLISLLLLSLVGYLLDRGIRRTVSTFVEQTMQAILQQQMQSLRVWLLTEEQLVNSWADDPRLRDAVEQLKEVARKTGNDPQTLRSSAERDVLLSTMRELTSETDVQFAVWNRKGYLIVDWDVDSPSLGRLATEYGASLLARIWRGESTLWIPTRQGYITEGYVPPNSGLRTGIAIMAPVRDDSGQVIAALLVSGPVMQERFDQILHQGRFLDSGETYAFSSDGYLLTESRFNDQLRTVGLVADRDDAVSALMVRVADPGGNLLEGFRNPRPPQEWPLTEMASAALAGRPGSDMEGYRDYRGETVVGVWDWFPDSQIGVATEVDYDDAFAPLAYLHRAFEVLLGGLMLTTLAAAFSAFALFRLRSQVKQGRQIGPYRIDGLIGEGGLGRVYLAQHQLLKRPTAIKVLRSEQINEQNLKRFEREVQLVSQLTHPNTIEIYDFGHTPEGLFYYAMEYVQGLNLQQLVELNGPLSSDRVVWILQSVCRSLREAHARGLVHRDIKPQNIMVCQRGGESDVVKVLDFGLAREDRGRASDRATDLQILVGTPMYIAPERITDPTCIDPRSDIFALGVVGFNLLTGQDPFEFVSAIDALSQTMKRPAPSPSSFISVPIPLELDALIVDCQRRYAAERPQSVMEVLNRLRDVPLVVPWTSERAAEWWEATRRRSRR